MHTFKGTFTSLISIFWYFIRPHRFILQADILLLLHYSCLITLQTLFLIRNQIKTTNKDPVNNMSEHLYLWAAVDVGRFLFGPLGGFSEPSELTATFTAAWRRERRRISSRHGDNAHEERLIMFCHLRERRLQESPLFTATARRRGRLSADTRVSC